MSKATNRVHVQGVVVGILSLFLIGFNIFIVVFPLGFPWEVFSPVVAHGLIFGLSGFILLMYPVFGWFQKIKWHARATNILIILSAGILILVCGNLLGVLYVMASAIFVL